MKKAAVIGHFGRNELFLDGQTVKTKTVTEWLKKEYGADQIVQYDTHRKYSFFFKSPILIFSALKRSENFVMLPAQNSLRVLTPIVVAWNTLFHRRLHYVVIGGWLPQMLTKRKALASLLKRFDYIYVETFVMKRALEDQGFCNVVVLPNCKNLCPLREDELELDCSIPYRLCTFSRVMKEKGIEDAINAVRAINEQHNLTLFSLDIYGQVDENQKTWFAELSKNFPQYVSYCGAVDFNQSVNVLKKYFALLFLTYYQGEGFAGTILDAMAAGVPVIATNWKYNTELISEENGFIVNAHDVGSVVSLLDSISEKDILSLKKSCLRKYTQYTPEKVMHKLIENFGD